MRRARCILGASLALAAFASCSGPGPSSASFSPSLSSGPGRVSQPAGAALHWTPIGPVLQRGSAGKLNAFAYVQSNPNVMFVGGGWGNTPRESPSQAGIYRTNDGGRHWQPADHGLTNRDGTISSVVNGLWIDQSDPSVLLAATEFGGTFRSTDGGATWQNVDRSESTQFAQAGSTLYVATRRGVLASADDGASWRLSLPSQPGATTVVTAGGATFAGDAAGNVFRRSGDGWSPVARVGTGAIHDIAIDPFDTNVVYANVDNANAWNEVLYGSIDGGKRWTRVFCHCQVGAQAIAFSRVVPGRLFLGDDGNRTVLYFTADGSGHPKIAHGASVRGNDIRYMFTATPAGSPVEGCYFLSDQGLFYDADCTAGSPVGLSNGIANFLAYGVTLAPDAKIMVVSLQDWGAVAGPVGGRLHFLRHSNEGGETFLNPYDGRHCYLAHPDQGLFISTDGCLTFIAPHGEGQGIESLAFEPPDGRTMYAIRHDDRPWAHVSISRDWGSSWFSAFTRFAQPYQVVVAPGDPKTLLVAAGAPDQPNYVYVSSNGGATWHRARGLPRTAPSIEQYYPAHRFYAAFDPNESAVVLLADHDPVTNDILIYRSRDGGRSFKLVASLLQPPTPRPWPSYQEPPEAARDSDLDYYAERFYGNRLAFDAQVARDCPSPVVLTTRFGAFESFDAGGHWRRIDTTAIAHHFIGATWVNGNLYLASFGQGVIESAGAGPPASCHS